MLRHPFALLATTLFLATSAPAQESPGKNKALGGNWTIDSDGNAIPDFIEQRVGLDPARDDCALKVCGESLPGAELISVPKETLLILDSSGSMAAEMGGRSKLDIAKEAIGRYASATSSHEDLGLMVYGHKGTNEESGRAESCKGVELLAPVGRVSAGTVGPLLERFLPTGYTPIALALQEAVKSFGEGKAARRVILVSDGIETCEGDPEAAARSLHDEGLAVEVHVVGFDIADAGEAAKLKAIAEAGGGEYTEVGSAAELDEYFGEQAEALARTFEAWVCEAGNTVSTNLCELEQSAAAVSAMRAEVTKSSSSSIEAVEAMIEEVYSLRDERDGLRADAATRAEALRRQADELLGALAEIYRGR